MRLRDTGWEIYTTAHTRSEKFLAACRFIGFARDFELQYPEVEEVSRGHFEILIVDYGLWDRGKAEQQCLGSDPGVVCCKKKEADRFCL